MDTETAKPFTPSDVVASLLSFLPEEFNNDPEKIHSTIEHLQQKEEYRYLLEEFEFLDYETYPYSPLLGRILNRMQEARLLSSLNPGYEKYVLKPASRKAIIENILNKKLDDQIDKLQQMASELETALR